MLIAEKKIPEHMLLKVLQKSSAAMLPAANQFVLRDLHNKTREFSKFSSAVCDNIFILICNNLKDI